MSVKWYAAELIEKFRQSKRLTLAIKSTPPSTVNANYAEQAVQDGLKPMTVVMVGVVRSSI